MEIIIMKVNCLKVQPCSNRTRNINVETQADANNILYCLNYVSTVLGQKALSDISDNNIISDISDIINVIENAKAPPYKLSAYSLAVLYEVLSFCYSSFSDKIINNIADDTMVLVTNFLMSYMPIITKINKACNKVISPDFYEFSTELDNCLKQLKKTKEFSFDSNQLKIDIKLNSNEIDVILFHLALVKEIVLIRYAKNPFGISNLQLSETNNVDVNKSVLFEFINYLENCLSEAGFSKMPISLNCYEFILFTHIIIAIKKEILSNADDNVETFNDINVLNNMISLLQWMGCYIPSDVIPKNNNFYRFIK